MAERPNALWVADITFLPTLAGFLYLAIVLDAWSRRIVGWAFSADLKTRVVLDARDMAIAARKPDNVVHHSDHGSQLVFQTGCRNYINYVRCHVAPSRVPRQSVFASQASCAA